MGKSELSSHDKKMEALMNKAIKKGLIDPEMPFMDFENWYDQHSDELSKKQHNNIDTIKKLKQG